MSKLIQDKSEKLEQLVVSTRRRLRRNAVFLGLGLLIIAGVGWLTVGTLLDILVTFPVWLRISV
ncbi:unnamed protein product, partial [marine sediment metagenome]